MAQLKDKLLIAVQPEIYRDGLMQALSSDYEPIPLPVLENTQAHPREAYRQFVEESGAELIIIGFDRNSAEISLDIGLSLGTADLGIIAVLFNTDRWLIGEVMSLHPCALLHFASSGLVVKQAIERAFKGEHFIDDILTEAVLSFSIEQRVGIMDTPSIYHDQAFQFIPQGMFSKEAASALLFPGHPCSVRNQNIYRKIGKQGRIEVIKLLYRNKMTLS